MSTLFVIESIPPYAPDVPADRCWVCGKGNAAATRGRKPIVTVKGACQPCVSISRHHGKVSPYFLAATPSDCDDALLALVEHMVYRADSIRVKSNREKALRLPLAVPSRSFAVPQPAPHTKAEVIAVRTATKAQRQRETDAAKVRIAPCSFDKLGTLVDPDSGLLVIDVGLSEGKIRTKVGTLDYRASAVSPERVILMQRERNEALKAELTQLGMLIPDLLSYVERAADRINVVRKDMKDALEDADEAARELTRMIAVLKRVRKTG